MFLIGIFWLAVIVFIIWAIWKYSKGSGIATVLSRDALEIVKERYAKGEISKKEFEEMKKELHKK
ncbi:SHOCT domain-containing protein [Candidatus Woesearchaeota archaeon]|nr:SHOCT domain-containing protein [Candidatus Woesearchaeota archaeon]